MFWNLCITTSGCLREEAGDDIDVHLLSVLGCLNTRVAYIYGCLRFFKTVLSSGYILILLSIEYILASFIEMCQG